jgi:two-component system invasion response regulator UvrY
VHGASPEEIRVLVVDDHPRFRALMEHVVDGTPGFRAVAGACTGEEALAHLERSPADLVLMDVQMPGAGGIAAARVAAGLRQRPLVVLMSGDDRPDIEADPPAHGAVAFVRKERIDGAVLRRLWSQHAAP